MTGRLVTVKQFFDLGTGSSGPYARQPGQDYVSKRLNINSILVIFGQEIPPQIG
jgi:hypothetical protein